MTYNKLVRDNIPDIIKHKGETCHFHVADDQEYGDKLAQKLQEEIAEFLEDESAEELADVLEVLDAFKAYKQFSDEDITRIKQTKRDERGAFEKRIILDEA